MARFGAQFRAKEGLLEANLALWRATFCHSGTETCRGWNDIHKAAEFAGVRQQGWASRPYAGSTLFPCHIIIFVNVLIWRRLFDVVDDDDVDRSSARFQSQAKLFLQRREK